MSQPFYRHYHQFVRLGEGQAISLKSDCFSTERIIQNVIEYRKPFVFLYMFSSEKGKRLARMTNVISQRYWPSLAGSQRGLDGNLSQTALMGNLYLYLHFICIIICIIIIIIIICICICICIIIIIIICICICNQSQTASC